MDDRHSGAEKYPAVGSNGTRSAFKKRDFIVQDTAFPSAGDLHLSDAEVDELLALADPSGSGQVTLQRLERLECWYRPNQKL